LKDFLFQVGKPLMKPGYVNYRIFDEF